MEEIKNYKEVIIGILLILLVAVFCGNNIIAASKKISATSSEHKAQKEKLKDVKAKIEEYEAAKVKIQSQQNKMKPVFDPKSGAEDSIAAFGGMFEDIIDYVKMNNLKLRSVEYIISPDNDPIYTKFPSLYSVAKIKLFIIGTYPDFEGLLSDLTVYPYFINISEVQINPYEKNQQYLLINLSVNLYAKKQQSAASIMN